MTLQTVTINSRKSDQSIHKSWQVELLEENDEIIAFSGVFKSEVRHRQLGVIKPGTISYEYYWKEKWFNVFRFHEPEGQLRNYYCNINMPPKFDNGILDYIDLDIDVLVWKDWNYKLLDLDEYLDNSSKYSYSTDTHLSVLTGLNEVLNLINTRMFPFDYADK